VHALPCCCSLLLHNGSGRAEINFSTLLHAPHSHNKANFYCEALRSAIIAVAGTRSTCTGSLTPCPPCLVPDPPAMAESPVFNVGSRVSLVWPMESGRVTGKIVSVKQKKVRRKRAHPSKFQYLLQWDDGTPPRWSRLLHLNPQLLPQEPESLGAATKAVHLPLSPLPWDCDDGDHCETPALAYAHIAPILALVASSLGTSSNLKLYDPYFCAGSTSTHLRALGFPDVYNRPVDFYAAQSSTPPDIPPFDLLVSNPPFSKDHPRRCMSYALNSGRPFLLLLPNYEACSTWLSELLTSCNQQLLYLAPHKRYVCRSPPSLRCGSNKALKYVAPFPLLWFIGLPDPLLRSQVLSAWQAASSSSPTPPSSLSWPSPSDVALVSDCSQLPPSSRPRGAKDAPDAVFKAAFNDFCRLQQLGKVCAEFAFTRHCNCGATSPFVHEPPPHARLLADFLRANTALQPPQTWKAMRPDVAAQNVLT